MDVVKVDKTALEKFQNEKITQNMEGKKKKDLF
jgi:hypothetical protein